MTGTPHVRFARPTDRLDEVTRFYRDAVGLEVVGSFAHHAGFDGIMLGTPGAGWHLELTHKRGHTAGRAPTEDNLLVIYLPDPEVWQAAVQRMNDHGHKPVRAFNPYWDMCGKTFEDPDGYRVVLAQAAWP